jgi:hypothetical protein
VPATPAADPLVRPGQPVHLLVAGRHRGQHRQARGEVRRREPGTGKQVEILTPAVVVVDRVAARLDERRIEGVFPLPVVAVDVVAFDLVAGGGGGPEETVGEDRFRHGTSVRLRRFPARRFCH